MESVADLVAQGAQRIAEGIQQMMSMADLGREVSRVQIKIHTQLRTREGLPDLRAVTDASKSANRRMYDLAQNLSGVDDMMMDKVIKGVHNHKSDVRAEYLRSLDEPGADLAPYASILRDDMPPSVAVAAHYGVSIQGRRERERKVMKRLRSVRGSGATPAERAENIVHAVSSLLTEATPDDYRYLDEDTRETVIKELGDAAESLAAITEAVQR